MAQSDDGRRDIHGFGERMSDLEALLWRMGLGGGALLPAMTLIVLLDHAPSITALEERLQTLASEIPRLRERPRAGILPMVPPLWERDPRFSVRSHLRVIEQPSGPASAPPQRLGGSMATLLAEAEKIVGRPFEEDRPPWEMLLIGDAGSGPSGIVVRLHHSYTDGLGALRLAASFFDPGPAAAPEARSPGRAQEDATQDEGAGRHPDGPERDAADVAFELRRTADVILRALPWAADSLREALEAPEQRASELRSFVSSLRRLAGNALRPSSDVLARRSSGTSLGVLDVSLPEAKAAARRAEGTVNDVFLAGLLAGLGLYHDKVGSRAKAVRIGIPISTRDGYDNLHNQVGGVLVRAPLRLTDPTERVLLVHELVEQARAEPAFAALPDAMTAALHAPGASRAATFASSGVDVVASNLTGSPVSLRLCGASVEAMVPIGPRGGAALNLTLLSYLDRLSIGVNADPAAVPDPVVLLDCLRWGFDETVSIGM